ncbi:MAG: hemerythrin domain-containing protein [Pseudonocardiaceae bacterium]
MTEIDFTGFLLAHKCMRHEYGRLADAARHPRGVGYQALIEKHIAVTLSVLHHHHAEEDNWLWPTLRERAPAASPALDRLEAQHTQIDPLVTAAADTSRPLPERALVLAELHDAINAHLEEEERLILPLAAAHISAEEWDAFGQRALASIPHRYLPIVLGWVSSEATIQEWAQMQQMLPRLVRILAQAFWVPAYTKRRRRLYPQSALDYWSSAGPGQPSTPRWPSSAPDIENDLCSGSTFPSLVSDNPSNSQTAASSRRQAPAKSGDRRWEHPRQRERKHSA